MRKAIPCLPRYLEESNLQQFRFNTKIIYVKISQEKSFRFIYLNIFKKIGEK
jgi:hypothetical protein